MPIAASLTDYLPAAKRALARLAGVKNVKRAGTMGNFRDMVAATRPSQSSPTSTRHATWPSSSTRGAPPGSRRARCSPTRTLHNAATTRGLVPLKRDDIALGVLPFFHIYGMTTAMNAPLLTGASIVLLPRFEVEAVMEAIQKERVTSFCGVPTMYIAVINHPEVARFSLKTIRGCISGGAPLPGAVSAGSRGSPGGRSSRAMA